MSHKKKFSKFFTSAKQNDIKEDYLLGKELGSGTFSIVRLGKRKSDGKTVAVKIIDKANLEVNKESLKTEVKILKSVRDPNIVDLYDVYEVDNKVYLVMECLTGGELFDRIVNVYPDGYSEEVASKLIKQIVQSIKYLHKLGIVHRDLKPENLLYQSPDDDSMIKITDFGLAKIASGDLQLKTACGTPNYVAPEVLMNNGYDAAVDMWSIGVILYILLCGFPPFYSESTQQLFDQILKGRYDFPSPYWDKVSPEAKDLISHLLCVDSSKRYTPDQCLSHPWITGNTKKNENLPKIIDQLKQFNAKRRFKITVEAVRAAQKFLAKLKMAPKKKSS